jgi:hypothetical protein
LVVPDVNVVVSVVAKLAAVEPHPTAHWMMSGPPIRAVG